MISVRAMRSIDYWVGVPLTFCLSLLHCLVRPFRKPLPGPPRSVCFIELSEAGSTVLAYSAVKRLQARFPEARLYWLIFRPHAPGLALLDAIAPDRLLTIRTDGFVPFVLDTWRVLVCMWRLRMDTVIDLELFSRFTSILSLLSGAGRRVGFHNGCNEGLYRGDHLTHRVAYNPHLHISQSFHALVDALAEPDTARTPTVRKELPRHEVQLPSLRPTDDARENGRHILRTVFPDLDPLRHKIVLLNPNAGALPLRAWPVGRYAEIAGRLVRHNGDLLVGVVGLPEAAPEADAIAAEVQDPRCASLVGRTHTFGDLIDLFHVSALLLTNDSGPAHFAAVTGLKVVAFFGPETPHLYGPLGEGNVTCLHAGVCCSPCLSAYNHRRSPCNDNVCLQRISVDQAWDAVAPWLPEPRHD